jgi:hypothetical protein
MTLIVRSDRLDGSFELETAVGGSRVLDAMKIYIASDCCLRPWFHDVCPLQTAYNVHVSVVIGVLHH